MAAYDGACLPVPDDSFYLYAVGIGTTRASGEVLPSVDVGGKPCPKVRARAVPIRRITTLNSSVPVLPSPKDWSSALPRA